MLARCDNLKVHSPSSDDDSSANVSCVNEKACKKRAALAKSTNTSSVVAFVVVITATNQE